MPDNRVQIIEAQPSGNDAEVRVEWEDNMTAKVATRQTHVTNDTDQPPTRD